MRIWDITDQVCPGLQLTEPMAARPQARGMVTSLARTAIVVAMAAVSTGSLQVTPRPLVSWLTAKFSIPALRTPGAQAKQSRRERSSATDTQYGQSTERLSRAFESYFEPAPDEPEIDEDSLA
jgi:hypothetical protein